MAGIELRLVADKSVKPLGNADYARNAGPEKAQAQKTEPILAKIKAMRAKPAQKYREKRRRQAVFVPRIRCAIDCAAFGLILVFWTSSRPWLIILRLIILLNSAAKRAKLGMAHDNLAAFKAEFLPV